MFPLVDCDACHSHGFEWARALNAPWLELNPDSEPCDFCDRRAKVSGVLDERNQPDHILRVVPVPGPDSILHVEEVTGL